MVFGDADGKIFLVLGIEYWVLSIGYLVLGIRYKDMKASDITHNEPLLNVKGIIRFFIISFIVLNIINLKYCFSFYVNSVTILLMFFLILGNGYY